MKMSHEGFLSQDNHAFLVDCHDIKPSYHENMEMVSQPLWFREFEKKMLPGNDKI